MPVLVQAARDLRMSKQMMMTRIGFSAFALTRTVLAVCRAGFTAQSLALISRTCNKLCPHVLHALQHNSGTAPARGQTS